MKKILALAALALLLATPKVHAQAQTMLCFQVPNSPVPSCVPVSITNPLPVISN